MHAYLRWRNRQHTVGTETPEQITISVLGLEALVIKKLQPEFKNNNLGKIPIRMLPHLSLPICHARPETSIVCT